jgi:hypothetical protein
MALLRPANVNINNHNIGNSWAISKEYDAITSSHNNTIRINSTSTFTSKLIDSYEDKNTDILNELTFATNVLYISLSHDEIYLIVILENDILEVLHFEEIILGNQQHRCKDVRDSTSLHRISLPTKTNNFKIVWSNHLYHTIDEEIKDYATNYDKNINEGILTYI